MFQVGRFDPKAEASANSNNRKKKKKKKSKKRKSSSETTTLRVIAPKTKPVKRQDKRSEEAIDDLDLAVSTKDVIEVDDHPETLPEEPATPEIAQALHMSSLPIRRAAETWKLAPFLVEHLQRDGFESFFPIQSLVIPDVMASEHHARILRVRDVCVAAPTGSGKTLAFCLPVLHALANRNVRRLRALVILPSRDLAQQVHSVFLRYSQGSDLAIGLAIGQSDFHEEQTSLVVGPPLSFCNTSRYRYALDPSNPQLAWKAFPHGVSPFEPVTFPRGGQSAVDVLVATPGRLMDHLDRTPGFTLQHLRFLVIDEADRLVSQSYHSFIGRIMDCVHPRRKTEKEENPIIDPITWRQQQGNEQHDGFLDEDGSIAAAVSQKVQLRKLLFSATLTKDPQKLAGLGLINPKHYDAHNLMANGKGQRHVYSMPPGLSEHTIECTAEQKPLVLMAVLLEQLQESTAITVVFTSSLDSTHRLVRLLQLLWGAAGIGDPSMVAEFSSALNQTQRFALLQRCHNKEVAVAVCSDGMSRGMDIAAVGMVVNYDVPRFAKTYVHRCGRTARAGRTGKAVSLLKDAGKFRNMRSLVEDPGRVQSGMPVPLLRKVVPHYPSCVQALKRVLQAEHDGALDPTTALDNNPQYLLS